jgi:hypothetical protein
MYRIEKGKPIEGNWGRRTKYPLADMEVGDSFLVPAEDNPSRNGLYGAIRCFRNKEGNGDKMFSCKSVKDGGIRCWRVK